MSQGYHRDPDLCVITCAVTGVLANRKQNPGIPYTPVEIAERREDLHDGELRPGQLSPLGELLREPAALRVEVDDRLEDLIDLGLDVGGYGGHECP